MKTKHVLVVEDNPDILVLTSEMLADLELDSTNLTINACSDGASALEQIQKHKFDLIITDLRLPHLNGDELIRKINSGDGPNRRTSVVLTSGYLQDFGEGRASLGPAPAESKVYILQKPFRRKELQSVVERWLEDQRVRA